MAHNRLKEAGIKSGVFDPTVNFTDELTAWGWDVEKAKAVLEIA